MDAARANKAVMAASANAEHHYAVSLDRAEVVLIIDALLQAEMTLPMIDRRHQSFGAMEGLRQRQLSLAERLEKALATTPDYQ